MKIEILSGEGATGSFKKYTGKRTLRAIRTRLTKECCGGQRWAQVYVDDQRVCEYDFKYFFKSKIS